MLATNRIRLDLLNENQYVVHLALVALSEICTTDMCRELAEIVSQLLKSENKYVKKQATLAATRIIRKSPENMDIFIDKIP